MSVLGGTVALVTGASSGIGEATARALAAQGAAVGLIARRLDRLDALAADITAAGGQALPLEIDVTARDQAAAAVERTVARFGRLDIVVNNAGVMLLGPAADADVDDWDRMVDLNIKGLLYVTRAALPHLLAAAEDGPRGVADLVNVSSTGGRTIHPGAGVYGLTKHGVGAFTESVRQEVATRHVRVSVVEPGVTSTELTSHLTEEQQRGARERWAAVETLRASDIADAIDHIVTRPRHVAVNEMMVRPTESVF